MGEVDKAGMVAFMKEKLPRYMIPNVIEVLDAMPFTANGKIDRVTLKNRYLGK